MMHREWRLVYSWKRGMEYEPNTNWFVVLYENSSFHNAAEIVADHLCALTGHHFCHRLYAPVSNWAMSRETEVARFPVERGMAESIDRQFVDRMDDDAKEAEAA